MLTLEQWIERDCKGLKDKQIAGKVGISRPFFAQLVEGVRGPGPATIKKFTEVAGEPIWFPAWAAHAAEADAARGAK